MKKLSILSLMIFVSSISYSQTTTTSNKAVFDGDNLSNTENILELGKTSNGGRQIFQNIENASGSKEVWSRVFDSYGNTRMTTSFSTASWGGASSLDYRNVNGDIFFNLYEIPTGGQDNRVFMSLNRPDSQFIIGSNTDFSSTNKFIVSSGNSFFDGNVGIGTESFFDNSLEYKLSVDGRIRAHEVKVYTSWADFVFKDDYELPALEDVETFIQEHGHLQHIPNETEVLEKGINVGEMNKLLLQKIEELTLYTIEQEKRIKGLEKQQILIFELQKELKRLKTKS